MTIARASHDSETTSREASGDSEMTLPEKLSRLDNYIDFLVICSLYYIPAKLTMFAKLCPTLSYARLLVMHHQLVMSVLSNT